MAKDQNTYVECLKLCYEKAVINASRAANGSKAFEGTRSLWKKPQFDPTQFDPTSVWPDFFNRILGLYERAGMRVTQVEKIVNPSLAREFAARIKNFKYGMKNVKFEPAMLFHGTASHNLLPVRDPSSLPPPSSCL